MANLTAIVEQLKEERNRLDGAIQALEGVGDGAGRRGRKPGRPAGRHMSAAARAKIAAAQRARWAKQKRASNSAPAPAAKKARRGGMSAANRKRQAERMKAYWAAKRKKQAASA